MARVNRAEAEYWRLSSGTRVGYSDEILGFDCGGEQLVLEVCLGGRVSGEGGIRLGEGEYNDGVFRAMRRKGLNIYMTKVFL